MTTPQDCTSACRLLRNLRLLGGSQQAGTDAADSGQAPVPSVLGPTVCAAVEADLGKRLAIYAPRPLAGVP
jgi:hypothetical protein